ncbi:hypothetical protein [Amycolatopsis sp. FDAARGOS 1241]|uniref:hypothetical protein n=1 Tax=Amycolatopsis sp. FDAARGOS 1241 TaxID=2778070 RepID=UPI0019509628|nr:hypothetical protein [Amycolatopsis sp. FDAARGOS 1241]QRP48474.1 hypothetical protein I6J71_11855 [Amycolatopsis sp. FDAARGOS 1241]
MEPVGSVGDGLLDPADWSASWLDRWTDPARRIVRSVESDHIAWLEPGRWLGQTVAVDGVITAVSVALVDEPAEEVRGRLELCDPEGTVLAAEVVERGAFRWDRFAHFLEVRRRARRVPGADQPRARPARLADPLGARRRGPR